MPPKGTKKKKIEGTVYYLNPIELASLDQQGPRPSTEYNKLPLLVLDKSQQVPSSKKNNNDENGLSSLLNACVSIGDVDLDISNAAFALEEISSAHDNKYDMLHDDPLSQNFSKTRRVLISRPVPEKYETVSGVESSERSGSSNLTTKIEPETAQIQVSNLPPLRLDSSGADITYSNGNNRERRRAELFDYYSAIHRYKEQHRDEIFRTQQEQLDGRLKKLSIPRDPNTETSTSYDIDNELYELEQDIAEARDYELTRLKSWRRFKRDEILKTYYDDSIKLYKDANDLIYDKLERLKSFFLRQKALLSNLDRDFSEIGSARAEKFYNGFLLNAGALEPQPVASSLDTDLIDQETTSNASNSNNELSNSETDTGGSSGGRRKARNKIVRSSKIVKPEVKGSNHGSQILSSILEGFAPLLTDHEFNVVTGDELSNRYSFNGSNATPVERKADSDTDGSTTATSNVTSSKKRGVGRPSKNLAVAGAPDPNGANSKENTASLNKIMKQYVSPDDLKPSEIEEDLELLRNIKN